MWALKKWYVTKVAHCIVEKTVTFWNWGTFTLASSVQDVPAILKWNGMQILFLFVWFDYLRPINNLSVKQGRVFVGWTSTKLG